MVVNMPTATSPDDRLDLVFAALADTTRRQILGRLTAGDATVGELLVPFDITQQAVSKHLKVLERAGLVSRTKVAQQRPCHLEPEPLVDAAAWIERHRDLWNDRYDGLDEHLRSLTNPITDPEGPT